jgi:YspA, cpYpsA-related SLOG family
MRVLICGGRQFEDAGFLWQAMDNIHARQPISEVIAGGAAGADTLGASWALERGIPCRVFMADWEKLGRSAGPIRNQVMLDEGRPDLVVAFPGHHGTADMVKRAREAGVPVRQPGI